jgi:hypothetical protein
MDRLAKLPDPTGTGSITLAKATNGAVAQRNARVSEIGWRGDVISSTETI